MAFDEGDPAGLVGAAAGLVDPAGLGAAAGLVGDPAGLVGAPPGLVREIWWECL